MRVLPVDTYFMVSTAIRMLVSALGRSLSPDRCAACEVLLLKPASFCGGCAATVSLAPPDCRVGNFCAVGAARYGGALATAIRKWKFEARPDVGRMLAPLVARTARSANLRGDMVTSVPLHPRRLAERGFNQSVVLGMAVARSLQLPFYPRLLRRTRQTAQQARLDRATRAHNVVNAFEARSKRVTGRRIIVVDDICTTGATLRACAAALTANGALSVHPLVLAITTDGLDYSEREGRATIGWE